MRIRLALALAAAGLALSLAACSSLSTDSAEKPAKESSQSSGSSSTTADAAKRSGDFEGKNDKKVSGTVTIAGGTVTLSGFSSDQGPDLHLYLANGTDEKAVAAGTELGTVAYDTDSQSFELKGVDASGFTDVVVHCDKAKAVFGAAELS